MFAAIRRALDGYLRIARAIAPRQDAEAIVFDFVQPARAARRSLSGGRQTGLDYPQPGASTVTQRHAGSIRTIALLVQ
jgi:hypothetical protein